MTTQQNAIIQTEGRASRYLQTLLTDPEVVPKTIKYALALGWFKPGGASVMRALQHNLTLPTGQAMNQGGPLLPLTGTQPHLHMNRQWHCRTPIVMTMPTMTAHTHN